MMEGLFLWNKLSKVLNYLQNQSVVFMKARKEFEFIDTRFTILSHKFLQRHKPDIVDNDHNIECQRLQID